MSALRRTLRRPTPRFDGIGLHTGAPAWARVLPDQSARGIVFRSSNSEEAQAAPDLVVDTRRCTALQIAGRRLSTVEHLMAALNGCGVTDAVVEFDGPEMPIMDGSARIFADALLEAGFADGADEIRPIVVEEIIDVPGANGERLIALPAERFSVTVVLDYPDHPALGAQAAIWNAGIPFESAVAPARTYGFLSEFEQVRALGLASGASLDNCVALLDDGSADPRTPLRFPNEPARHKLLDVMGDLALAGAPIQGQVIALKPSHAVNCSLARQLAARAR